MSKLIVQECRVQHYLSGNRDEDYFLTQEDMSEEHWQLLMSCYHQGHCDNDCEEAARYFDFKDDQGYINACNYLIECDIERDRFTDDLEYPELVTNIEQITDTNAVLEYYLWILSCDLQERCEDE